ncbi:uncharacterized protein LOC132696900 [Cylas formicarius]|uniref:uncharacterized protein LOC132696900 n=1 Tax=Cylas formicarius TaxID=197179 RepID=UPI00295837AE|nr:uncharacterized protein LOC132696900 [Cylas formicarius]XP_060518010.1 uncharacterized protein LOC132696900 [Cylas formicarius]
MSDTSEDTISSDRQNDKEDSICRDFARGICDRKFCKFKHENEIHTLNFCHDYQNNVCPRPYCKFIHCTADEVEEYKRTGEMSNQILAEATRKNQLPGVPPVCNQFKMGLCRRANCKFRHVTKALEEAEIMELIQNNVQRKQANNNNNEPSQFVGGAGNRNGFGKRPGTFDHDLGIPFAKRLSAGAEIDLIARDLYVETDRPVFKGYFAGTPPAVLSRVDARTLMLEEENNLLHKEIAQLKKQVQDLTATNEFLLDQNATLRVSNKHNNSIPAVSLTNTNAAQPQQVIRTVTASVGTVPVSLATVSTCNPVSITGCPTVSIASPAQILAPSQQILVTTNPAQQLALATSTQLTSQAQHIANQQLALANAPQQLTTQPQQLTLANNPQTHQQLNQQLTSQAQQLATQQLTSQAQQLALANTTQQLTSQAQQLALANTTQQLAVANVPPQQLALTNTGQQLLAAQQNLAASTQQIELHRNNQINAINTSQTIAMSNASQPMVSYPIMTQSMSHGMPH